jgi:hypothetical protein
LNPLAQDKLERATEAINMAASGRILLPLPGLRAGNGGTGKTHVAIALGLTVCRLGQRIRSVTAASLVIQLEEAQQQHRLDRLLSQLPLVEASTQHAVLSS